MKKLGIVVGVMFIVGVAAFKLFAAAGNQYNWGTSTGGSWSTPNDTTTVVGQPLQIGSTGLPVVVAGNAPLSLVYLSSAAIAVLTPGTTGQIVYCSNCINTTICVATGTAAGTVAGGSSWASVFFSTSGAVNTCR